jgi:hypothetical protein
MENTMTVGQVFEVAIAAERAVERLFHGLEAKFAPHPDLAQFWRQFALEEDKHARWLISASARLSPEQLAAPVAADTAAAVRQTATFSVEQALGNVKNLEDAYELVTELESGETNAIFRFLLDHFEPDEQTANFIRAQLSSHMVKMSTDLPAQYRTGASHRTVKALD